MELLEVFERYFNQEGLLAVVPHWRRKEMGQSFSPEHILSNMLIFGWLILSALANALLSIWHGEPVWISVLTPIVAFVVWFITMVIVTLFVRQRSGKDLDAKTVGGSVILVLPLFYALGVFTITRDFLCFILSIGTQFFLLVVLIILFAAKSRFVWIFDVLKMIRKVLPQAWTSWRFAAPILFVTVLLSFLSEEIWRTIGQLTWERLLLTTVLIALPAILFFVKESREELDQLLTEVRQEGQAASMALSSISHFRSCQERDWISVEEWETITHETGWKYLDKLGDDAKPFINRRLQWRFWVMVGFLFALLFISILAYFLILSYLIFSSDIVEQWTGLPSGSWIWSPILRVSAFISVFLLAVFAVSAFTDEPFRLELLADVKSKATHWWAAITSYQAILRPGYQIWHVIKDGEGIMNALLIVPTGAENDQVERALRHMAYTCEEYNLVRLNAFEKAEDTSAYRLGSLASCWSFTRNKAIDFEELAYIPGPEVVEDRYDHFLGPERAKASDEIPSQWFGSDPATIELGKSIWQTHQDGGLVLHPFVQCTDTGAVFVDIHLAKRLSSSSLYQRFSQQLLRRTVERFPEAQMIEIALYFRDTYDTLARLTRIAVEDTGYATYRDEYTKERIEPLNWGLEGR